MCQLRAAHIDYVLISYLSFVQKQMPLVCGELVDSTVIFDETGLVKQPSSWWHPLFVQVCVVLVNPTFWGQNVPTMMTISKILDLVGTFFGVCKKLPGSRINPTLLRSSLLAN